MRALRWYGIHDVRTETIEKPAVKAGEVLVRIAYAGICGSDLHIYNKGMFIRNVPETMGHEFSGTVEEAGPGVAGFMPGDKVIANPMVPCGKCPSCLEGSFNTCEALGFIGEVRQGCFTEYISLPASSLVKLPDGADLEKAALTEPLAVAVNLCRRASFRPSDSLAVIGAGPIGLLSALVAREVHGVRDITVVNRSETRRRIAEKLGAAALPALPDGSRFDRVIEAAGSSATMMTALTHVKANGIVLAVSVFEDDCTVDMNLLVCSQITLIGSNCYGDEDLKTAAELIGTGKLDVSPVISGVYSLEDGAEAFRRLASKDRTAAKLLLKP